MAKSPSYRTIRFFAPITILAYLGIVLLTGRLDSRPEVFPFFNWSLFSYSAGMRVEYALLVRSIDGRELSPPHLFFDMKDTFASAKQKDVNLWKVVQELGGALHQKNDKAAGPLQTVIQRRYMTEAATAQYDLVRLTYDPIQRLRTGEIKNITIVASFEKTDE